MAISFQIGFRLDDKELKQGLAGIQGDIQRAFTIRSENGISKELKNATNQAMVLEKALKKATTDKGISYAQLETEFRKAGTSAGKLTAILAQGGSTFTNSLNAANNALALSNRQVLSMNKTIQEMGRVLKQSFKFTAAQTFIRQFSSELSQAVRWVSDLNDAVNDIGIVTGKTASQLEGVAKNAIKGSKELRVAAKDYTEGALIFYQQGLDDEEVVRRNEITIKAAKAANQSIQEMSKELTAIWNTYGMVGDEQLRAASVGARMAAQTAVDFKDIAEAMQTAAAPAAQMGVEYNQLAAIIATVGDTTQQSASVIGNAYKTIFSRFQQLTTEGTDGEVTLNSVSSKLDALGIKVLDSAGNLRQLGQVINEVGTNWDSWSEKQQLAIAELVGGTRQYGQFLALMNNFDKYQKNLQSASMEDGSTLEAQYTKALDSIESRAENAAEAWHRAFSEVINADQLKTFYSAIEAIGEGVGSFLKALGGAPGILTVIITLLSGKIIPAISSAGASLKTLWNTLTPQGRTKQINKNFDDADKAIDRSSGMDDDQKQIAKNKNEFSRETALLNEKIETSLNTATGAYKTQLEMAKEILRVSQQQYQQSLDEEQALTKKVEAEGKALAIKQEQLELAAQLAQAEYDQSLSNHQTATINVQEAKTNMQLADENVVQAQLNVMNQENNLAAAQSLGDQNLILEATQNLLYARNELAQATAEATAAQQEYNDAVKEEERSEKNINESRQEAEFTEKAAAVNKLTIQYNKMAKAIGEYDKAGRNSDNHEKNFNDTKSAIDDVIKQMKEMPGLTDSAKKEISDLGEALVNATEESGLDEILADIMAIRESLSEGFEVNVQASDELLEAHGNVEQAVRQQREARQSSERPAPENNEPPEIDFEAYISGLVQIGAAAVTATEAVGNLIDVWGDSESTAQEKIAALVALIPSIGAVFTALQGGAATLGKALGMAGAEAEGFGIKGFLAGLKLQAGMAPILPILYAIVAVVALVAIALTAWKIRIEQMQKARQKEVDSLNEELQKTNELTDAIKDNTQAAKDNITAYQDLASNGEDASEAYQKMIDSLNELNKSLEEAGVSQEELNSAMTKALATGDMDEYYSAAGVASKKLYEQQMEQYAKLNQAQVKLSEANMKEWGDFNGPTKTQIASTQYAQGEVVIEPSAALKDLAGKSDLLEKNGGTITLNLEFDNAANFRKQYKDLVKLREELEKTGGSKSEISALDKQIEGMTEDFEALEQQVAEARAAMEEMTLASIQAQTDVNNGGINLEGMDLREQAAYMDSIFASMKEQGLAVGMTMEEIENSFRGVIAGVPELNTSLASLDQIGQITKNVLNSENGGWGVKEQVEKLETIKKKTQDLQKVLDDGAKKSGIGRWFNGLSAEEEYVIDTLGKTKEEVEQEIKDLDAEAEAAMIDVQQKVTETFNNLSLEDRKLLLETGVDFVDDEEDIQQILDNMKDLKLRVNVEFKNEDQLRSEIDEDNTLQKNMQPAIKEYQDTGMVSVDTAREMIDAGLADYLMVVNDHFVLTTGAAEGFNASLDREKDNTQALLEVMTELRAPSMAFAEQMAVLNATMDDPALEAFTKNLEEAAIGFLNSEGGAQDLIEYFQTMQTAITDSFADIKTNVDDLTSNQMQQLLRSFEAIGTNLADSMAKADAAVAKGEMTIGEYREALTQAGEAQRQASTVALEASQSRMNDTIRKVNEQLGLSGEAYLDNVSDLKKYIAQQKNAAKQTNQSTDKLDDLTDTLSDAQSEYDGIENSIKDFDDAMSDMKSMEKFTDTVTENFESLQGILDNDFSLKFNIEDLDTTQLETLKTTVQSALDSISGLSEEAMNRVADTLFEAQGNVESFVVNGTNYTREGLITALKNHEITAEALMQQGGVAAEAILKAAATENEQSIKTAGQAIGTLMSAVGELISNFKADITVGIEEANLQLNPSWSGPLDLGAKLLAGKPVSIKPTGSLKFSISGGLTGESADNFQNALSDAANYFNTSDAGGLTDGMPDLSDYSTQTPTMADPTEFRTPEGTDKPSGGKDDKEKEFKKQEENDLKREKERYVNINSTLASLEKTIDKVASAEEDAWGVQKLRNLRMMNRLLGEQNALLSAKYKEARNYYDSDISNLINDATFQGAGLSMESLSFNNDMTIANRENLEDYLWARIVQPAVDAENALIAGFNNAGVADEATEKAIEEAGKTSSAAKEKFEGILTLLDKVDDSANTAADVLKQMVENVRASMNRLVDYIRQKLEIHVQVDERDMRRLDQLIDRFGEIGVLNGEDFAMYSAAMELQANKLQDIMGGMSEANELLANIQTIDINDPNRYTQGFGKDLKEYFGLNDDSLKALDEYLEGNGQLPAEIMNFLTENRDALEEGFESYLDTALTQLEGIFTRIENWLDEVYQSIDNKLEYNDAVMDYYQSALDFKGTNYIQAEGRDAQRALMEGRMKSAGVKVQESVQRRNDLGQIVSSLEDQVLISKNNMEEAKKKLADAEELRKVAEDKRRKAAESNNKAELERARAGEVAALENEHSARLQLESAAAQYNAFETQLKEYRQQYEESAAEIVRSQDEIMQAMIDNIEQERQLAKGQIAVVINGLFSDIDDMRSMYDMIKQEGDYNFDDYDKEYNIDKLQGQYDDAVENGNYSVEQLENLAAWQEKLNEYKQQGVNMTQDEADLLAKQLEILTLQSQMEDQMNAKNTMRLQRDASGNYSYVYSSDQSAEGDDQAQKLRDLEYQYKQMLEGVQDKAADTMMSVTEQIVDLGNNVNWQLYQSSELYRRSIDVKMSSLMNLLSSSEQESIRVFDTLNNGVGIWDANWAEHAGGILTQTTTVQDAFKNIRDALVGPDGYQPGSEDTSTYFGAIMSGQHYWADTATTELKNATASLADEDQGIPHDFALVTEKVDGSIQKIAGPGGSYQYLTVESQKLEKNIRKVLLNGQEDGDDNNIEYDWNKLELAIKTQVGTIVNTDLADLSTGLTSLKTSTGTTLGEITGQFTSWRENTNREIDAVIGKIKEYLALTDQKENENNDNTYTQPTATQVVREDKPTVTEQPVLPSTPVVTTTPTAPSPSSGMGQQSGGNGNYSQAAKVFAFAWGRYMSSWASESGMSKAAYNNLQAAKQRNPGLVAEAKQFTQTADYQNNVGNGGWAKIIGSDFPGGWNNYAKNIRYGNVAGYATGGLVDEEQVIKVAEKGPELVLNAEDTKNILAAVSLMRQTVASQFGSINGALLGSANSIANSAAAINSTPSPQSVDQQVHIEASFPGVSVASEIEDALNSLITQAAQYNIKR